MAARDWDNDRVPPVRDGRRRSAPTYEAEYEPIFAKFKAQTDAEHDEVVELGGLYVAGHRAARVAPHRQPAPRPFRPPGRPGRVAVLPVARGRPDAAVRVATASALDHGAAEVARRTRPSRAKMVTQAVENAQKQIEELNYERRKNVLKYDDVMNHQREVIYGERRKILEGTTCATQALEMVERGVVGSASSQYATAGRVLGGLGPRGALVARSDEVYPVRRPGGRLRRRHDARRASSDRSSRRRWPRTTRRKTAVTRRGHARARARWCSAEHHRHEVARAPRTRWTTSRRASTSGVRAEGPAHGVPARGVRHVRRAAPSSIREDFVRYIYRVEFVRPEAQQSRAAAGLDNRAARGERRRRGGDSGKAAN